MRMTLRLPDGRMEECRGCGGEVPGELAVNVWMRTPLGKTSRKAHRGRCELRAVENEREQPAERIDAPQAKRAGAVH